MNANEDADIQVTWEDQNNINSFSKLNVKFEDLQETFAAKKLELEYLDDLAMELELADEDEPISYKVGDVFMLVSLEEAQERIQTEKDRLEVAIQGMRGDLQTMEDTLAALKKGLYAKFKSAINLEKD
ncbi:hypothetical protein IWQ60_002862 [Tieghemiomyces parasiticus]|uniref:Prefoldin subunit 4 n=1 Tax=Tieghemiomyces parasiticus TaxID=78921 RepID=A0A9W8AAK9_9FUNG|nr:hypothetical protein IWQ60_002862 [Tieghemiomyces parasiticus]